MELITAVMIVVFIAWMLPTPKKISDRLINNVILITRIWMWVAGTVFVASIIVKLISIVI